MKASHYTTPRTMNDADFQAWGAAIETPPARSESASNIFLAVVCVAGCAVIGALCAHAF